MKLALAAALVLLASPAFAVPNTPGMLAEIDDYRWRAPVLVDDYMFEAVYLGDSAFHFEGAMLADVATELGGSMVENYDHRWLCYDAGGLRIRASGTWLEFEAPSPLELVTIEPITGPDPDCLDQPAVLPQMAGDVPSIGATLSDVFDRFGETEYRDGGRVAYRSVAVLGDEESWSVIKTVYYRFVDAIVTEVAYQTERRDNPHFGGWAEGIYALSSPNAIYVERPDEFTGPIPFGGTTLTFESDTLPGIIDRFGGTLRQQGEAGGHVVWVCYTIGRNRLWFTSDGEMGGDEHRLTGLTLDRSDDFDFSYGCTDAPEMALPALGVPGVGASVADLAAKYGSAPVDDRGHVRYVNYGDIFQSLEYQTDDGIVTGVGLTQQSGD